LLKEDAKANARQQDTWFAGERFDRNHSRARRP